MKDLIIAAYSFRDASKAFKQNPLFKEKHGYHANATQCIAYCVGDETPFHSTKIVMSHDKMSIPSFNQELDAILSCLSDVIPTLSPTEKHSINILTTERQMPIYLRRLNRLATYAKLHYQEMLNDESVSDKDILDEIVFDERIFDEKQPVFAITSIYLQRLLVSMFKHYHPQTHVAPLIYKPKTQGKEDSGSVLHLPYEGYKNLVTTVIEYGRKEADLTEQEIQNEIKFRNLKLRKKLKK